jgi:hypothetical protein
MPERSQTVVKLYYASRAEADEAAASLDSESLHGEVAQTPLGKGWAVTVSGPPDAVERFANRIAKPS